MAEAKNPKAVSEPSLEDLQREMLLVELETKKAALEKAKADNLAHREKMEEVTRTNQVRVDNIKANDREVRRKQSVCNHKSGGRDQAGLWNGDGALYGYSVNKQTLPTGETYVLCLRCGKEWRKPKTSHVRAELITEAQFISQNTEYQEAMRWSTTNEPCVSVLFSIPGLEQ